MDSSIDRYTCDWEREVRSILSGVQSQRNTLIEKYNARTKAPEYSSEDKKEELWQALKGELGELLVKIVDAQRLALENSNPKGPVYLDGKDHLALHMFELKDFLKSETLCRETLGVRLETQINKPEFKEKIDSTKYLLLMAVHEIATEGLRDPEETRLEALELVMDSLDESNSYWEKVVKIGLDCITKLVNSQTREISTKWAEILRKHIVVLDRTDPRGSKLILAKLKLLDVLEYLGNDQSVLKLARDLDPDIRQYLETVPPHTERYKNVEEELARLQRYIVPPAQPDDSDAQSPIHSRSSTGDFSPPRRVPTFDLYNCLYMNDTAKVNLLFDSEAGDPHEKSAIDGNKWFKSFILFRLKTLENASVGQFDKRVVVTVIDTGIDASHSYFEYRNWNSIPIKGSVYVERFRDFATDKPLPDLKRESRNGVPLHVPVDADGHGTFIAGILFRLVPEIDLRVARIGVKREDIENDSDLPLKVAKAIDYARETWNTEIIVMSFRCKGTDEVTKAVKAAVDKNILIFAATGNRGLNDDLMCPATEDKVFKISSTNSSGNVTSSSTPSANTEFAFCTLGVSVESAWPPSLRGSSQGLKFVCPRPEYRFTDDPRLTAEEKKHPPDCHECHDVWTVMSGTSFAAPIAASFAAMIYQFYNKYKSQFNPSTQIKLIKSMSIILKKMAVTWKGTAYLKGLDHNLKSNHFTFIPDPRNTAVNLEGQNYDEFFMAALQDAVARGELFQ